MKKILSLVLAVAMLSSMAFAGTLSGATTVKPGAELEIGSNEFVGMPALYAGDFNSDNFRVVKQSFSKGSKLVKSVAFDNDTSKLVVTMNEDYSLVAPKSPNVIISEISVQAKKAFDLPNNTKISRSTTYKYDLSTKSFTVGFNATATEVKVTDSGLAYPMNDMVKYIKDGTDVYGIASASGSDYYIEGRVYDGDKVYFNGTNKPNKDVIKLYENADLRFVNITTNGLPSNNDIQITAEKDEFVYKVIDGKIAASGLKWSDDDYAWVGKLRTTTSYVISDIELKVSASAGGSENPDTGANDVVGVAAALAVISLVAAGAVSLKK